MHPRSEAIFIPHQFFVIADLWKNNSCPNTRLQVKNDLVLGASRWPVFTRPSLAAFHLTAEGGPLGPGRRRRLGENNRRYLRFFKRLWKCSSVEGFRTMAE